MAFISKCFLILSLIGVLNGVLFFLLKENDTIRQTFFASLCASMARTSSPEMKKIRCDLLKNENIKGKVLEIGFGPGTNLNCFSNQTNTNIESYVGIEPNVNFDKFIVDELTRTRLNFPFEVKHGFAESLDDFEDESIDTVISTHVLCSVDELDDALDEIYRVLKPGGRFVFLEHVATDDDSWTTSIQRNIRPIWRVFGDGCEFRDIASALKASFQGKMQLKIDEFLAPFPKLLQFVSPHVKGIATKI